MNRRLAFLVGTWFGCGYWPTGPGTAGSLAALAIAWPVAHFAGFQPRWFLLWAGVLMPIGIWAASIVEKAAGKKDPGIVVVDEVAGQWLTLGGAAVLNWKSVAAAFVLFRIFDIWKPFPVRRLERLPAGWGIVCDDLMAGVYGALVLLVAGCFNLY